MNFDNPSTPVESKQKDSDSVESEIDSKKSTKYNTGRLYAKVEKDKALPIRYSSTISPLLNPASFHEYRDEDAMLQKKLDKAVADDLKKAM